MTTVQFMEVTKEEAEFVVERIINYPFFVPDLGANVRKALIVGDRKLLLDELERLSALGSRPASALLAYLFARCAFTPEPELSRAESLCGVGAREGDSYSQYVMGCVCRLLGREAEAMDWLKKAAIGGLFRPAFVDIAQFMACGIGVASPDRSAAARVLWDAHKLGHKKALVYLAELMRGDANLFRRLLGKLLRPVAVLRASRFVLRNPFSDQVFVTSVSATRPLLKDCL